MVLFSTKIYYLVFRNNLVLTWQGIQKWWNELVRRGTAVGKYLIFFFQFLLPVPPSQSGTDIVGRDPKLFQFKTCVVLVRNHNGIFGF